MPVLRRPKKHRTAEQAHKEIEHILLKDPVTLKTIAKCLQRFGRFLDSVTTAPRRRPRT
jgi:hypothetical protein